MRDVANVFSTGTEGSMDEIETRKDEVIEIMLLFLNVLV